MEENWEVKADSHFITRWVLVCILGYGVGDTIGVIAGEKIGYSLWYAIVSLLGMAQAANQYSGIFAGAVMGAVGGATIGISEWLVLRKCISKAGWWVWIGLVCSSMGIVLNSIWPGVTSLEGYFVPTVLTATLTGFLEQRLVLQESLPNSTDWIVVRVIMNSIVFLIGFVEVTVFKTFGFNVLARYGSNAITGLIVGAIVGLISGLKLDSYLRRVPTVASEGIS